MVRTKWVSRFRFAVALVAFGLVVAAQAGILYTVRTSDRMLQTFNTSTLSFTNVGVLGAPYNFGDLAYDSSSSTMYMVEGFAGTNLYTVNPTNANTTLIGSHGFTDMFGLTIDQNGAMWGGRSSGSGTGLYSINKGTGAATFVGNAGGNYLDGLAYIPGSNTLVGAYAGPGQLLSMDRTTGGVISILSNGPFFDNCGIAWDPGTSLLWLVDWSGNVMSFDPANSYARTLRLTGQGAHDGLVSLSAVPEPASMVALGLGLAALVRKRRK